MGLLLVRKLGESEFYFLIILQNKNPNAVDAAISIIKVMAAIIIPMIIFSIIIS